MKIRKKRSFYFVLTMKNRGRKLGGTKRYLIKKKNKRATATLDTSEIKIVSNAY